MKQNKNTVYLKEIMDRLGLQGVSAYEGILACQELRKVIDLNPQFNIFYISVEGVFFDASFARESIVKLAKHYKLNRGICLVGIADEDVILDNLLGPIMRLNQPIAYYCGDSLRHVSNDKSGAPSKTNKRIFAYILENGISTASDIARHFDMKLNNVSTKLKGLYEEGYLLRKEEKSDTGGIEYLYYAIS